MPDRYRCILLFGAPGVGKGTQGKLLGAAAGFHHLATGDMFRSLDKVSELGREFLKYSSKGLLVPDELTVRLWQEHVQRKVESGEYRPGSDLLVLDGIPRSEAQARALEPHIDVLQIVHLVAPDIDEMVHRMKRRAEQEGRPDDADESVIRRRFEVYEQETAPVLGCYDKGLVSDVDAMGSIEAVASRVRDAVMPVYEMSFQSSG